MYCQINDDKVFIAQPDISINYLYFFEIKFYREVISPLVKKPDIHFLVRL
jgi:hypothetical protein